MDFTSAAFYFILYVFVYVQVFWLVTFFENRRKLTAAPAADSEGELPSVSVIIPCYNEEKTVARTIRSVLELDYPRDKISIIVVDDGSTDGTRKEVSRFAGIEGVLVLRKENGGKFTALNLGADFILYFYSNEDDCPDCEKQGYVLTALREKYDSLRAYSFDAHADLSAVQALLDVYGRGELPLIAVNGKAYRGFRDAEFIEKLISAKALSADKK